MRLLCVALLAIFCNLQHGNAAADVTTSKSEAVVEEEKITSAGTSVADDSGQDAKPSATETVEENSNDASVVEEELGVHPDDPDSPEYIAYMEKLDRMAAAENGAMESKIADDLIDDEIEAAARAGVQSNELEQPHGEDGEFNPKESAPLPPLIEESANIPASDEHEEAILPTKYPELNIDTTHVSYIDPEHDSEKVHVSLEYSFFKGADQYEVCINCFIEDGKRKDAEVLGEVKNFSRKDPFFCEIGPACFTEFVWTVGSHSFSLRAHTAAKGWTEWSPSHHFQIEPVVGLMTYVSHTEL